MCAIGGYQLKNNASINGTSLLLSLQNSQNHRGPDGRGIYIEPDESVGLCHNRLSIVDLSNNGKQPMTTYDQNFIISFNGEIYNWKDLRNEMYTSGLKFRSNTDTEVVLNGYRKWGYDILQKIRGMYAFAIWDKRNKTLFCARDRIGKKPFIYGESKKGFFFSSEISALNAVKKLTEINMDKNASSLANMLLHNLRHIPEPLTVYKGLKKLRPGHAIVVKNGKVDIMWRHWKPNPKKINHPNQLREVVEEAVNIRSVADVPVGALLSGGLDSTTITCLMQKKIGNPINTYAFGKNKNDEDLLKAKFVANKLKTNHKEFYFDPSRQYKIFKKILKTYGEPIMLLPLIHTYELSEAIYADGIKVVLNGNGADELFYGYKGHLNTAFVTKLINIIYPTKKFLPKLNFNNSKLSVVFSPPGKRKSAYYKNHAVKLWPTVFKKNKINLLQNIVSEEMETWGELIPNKDFIDESNFLSLIIENTHSLTISSDLPGMMASVEMRSPFLDQEVISSAMGIHFSQKVKGPKDGSKLKNILRKAVNDLIPPEIMSAPKRGFGVSIQEKDLLLGEWKKYADNIFNDFPIDNEYFDKQKIRKIWSEKKIKPKGDWSLLSKLFAIGTWEIENKCL